MMYTNEWHLSEQPWVLQQGYTSALIRTQMTINFEDHFEVLILYEFY